MNGQQEAASASQPAANGMNGEQAKKLTAAQKKKLKQKEREKAKKAERAALRAKQEQLQKARKTIDGTAAEEPEVIIEYVSAPREFEELLDAGAGSAGNAGGGDQAGADGDEQRKEQEASAEAPDEGAEAMDEDEARPGLGGLGLGLGAAPGLGLGASPGLGLGAGGPGVGLGFGPGGLPQDEGVGGGSGEGEEGVEQPSSSSAYEDFKRIFNMFASAEELTGGVAPRRESDDEEEGGESAPGGSEDGGEGVAAVQKKDAGGGEEEEGDEEEEGTEEEKLSKKKRKLERRLKIAELKQACARPEVVEVWDVTAVDPKLLVHLKAYRNTVAVPRHWSQKRSYLQGKRGLEKPPFKLPDFIEATGIGEMRTAYHEKEDAKKLKQKQRERMQPKMGKLDIDYQVLHDAFFKYQTKPKMTGWGELYYEGKEFEAHVSDHKPGVLSPDLHEALGMEPGAPPPWLINMQRYGPPPSYPDLKIPGLNAPIPPGAQFGYQQGGWGKPPVDEMGNPLYGDVFGLAGTAGEEADSDEEVPRAVRWGELESEEELSEEEEESEEEEGSEEGEGAYDEFADGYASVASAVSSMPSGLETPEVIDLRKKAGGGGGPAPQLFTVLEQKQAAVGANVMGSDHVYVLPGAGGERKPLGAAAQKRLEMLRREMPSDVQVALDPEELEAMDEGQLKELYESKAREARAASGAGREDFSDLVAAKAADQKRKASAKLEAKTSKKAKDSFKF